VQIMGQSYLLACPAGGESALLDAVERVDAAMCRIRDAGKVKARDRIAVLASLNLAFELSQKQSQSASAPSPAATSGVVSTSSGARLEGDTQGDPVSRQRVADLIHRLDQALGEDGRLL
jgi:cell division protein ZapA